MPMKLSARSFFQMHLAGRKYRADRKVRHDLLSHPPSVEKPLMRIGKAPFQVRNDSVVGGLGADVVRVLKVQFMIGGPTWSGYQLKKLFQRGVPTGKGSTKIPFDRLSSVGLLTFESQRFGQWAGIGYAESAQKH